ncbi:hypothetical protein PR048_024888 [Dryococelus australis]|uniref:Uncharacterized protein n=1 Tax=Dryococelus australis TaxID=614101 RepID=A0ABQ9GPV5_9NEOP|nr:hypothetical protein PR048_024888 [Dryococelus australis]
MCRLTSKEPPPHFTSAQLPNPWWNVDSGRVPIGAVVAERLACSPPTKANRVQSTAGPPPDFRMWETCWTMPLVSELSRGFPVSSALSFRRLSILTSITLIGSQDLAVKSRPNLFTHSLICLLFNHLASTSVLIFDFFTGRAIDLATRDPSEEVAGTVSIMLEEVDGCTAVVLLLDPQRLTRMDEKLSTIPLSPVTPTSKFSEALLKFYFQDIPPPHANKRTMPLVGGFYRGSHVSPALSFRRCSILTSFTLIGSEALDVKSRPNLSTHALTVAFLRDKHKPMLVAWFRIHAGNTRCQDLCLGHLGKVRGKCARATTDTSTLSVCQGTALCGLYEDSLLGA